MLPLTKLGHGRQGQTKMGGVKWVSNPHVRVKDEAVNLIISVGSRWLLSQIL